MSLAPGTRLGPYEIIAAIGAGGMGEVYRARDTRLDREVAIKVLPSAMARDPDRLARFEREARVLASLNHPHIATIYGLEESTEGTALAMELVDGCTLKSPLPVAEALRIAGQIAEALEAAHKRGIVHRDLKPANVMVTETGVKLLDFGLAKIDLGPAGEETATQTQAGTLLGTACYMSPEQAQGRPVDARSDIFSFGAVLYELVTGNQAFRGESMVGTLASILRDEPVPADCPTEVQNVIARCLRKHAADRFQTAGELRAAVEAAARSRTWRSPSLAVLPFANLSADKENEYFSDGLAEEILNSLTQLPGLRVIARASSFAFRGRENAIAEIGERLQVSSVLHGSVRRAGNRIRVSVQLINIADESQIWSERYDREMRDVFDIQDEIAQAIVAQLKVKLGDKSGRPLVKRYTENLEAHSLYLKGTFHVRSLRNEDMEKGRACLEEAVAMEPNYAPAWVLLADYYIASAHRGGASSRDQWSKARAAARRALEADPEFADAHAALGFVAAVGGFEWEEGLRGLDTALRMNPASALAQFWRAHVLWSLGKPEEALAAANRAADLDPFVALFSSYCALYSLMMARPERALKYAVHALEVHADYPIGMLALGEAYSLLGRHEEGIRWGEKTRPCVPPGYFYIGFLGLAYVRAGRRADAERLRTELEEKSRHEYISPATLAFMAATLGDLDSLVRLIEEAIAGRDPNIAFAIRSPYFRVLHADPRYGDLLRRMNLDQSAS
jgi:eukaryotic-like serine/threonine-protein kinase